VPVPRSSGRNKTLLTQRIRDHRFVALARQDVGALVRKAALEGRRAAEDTVLLGPDRLALGKRSRELILDPAALIPENGIGIRVQ